MRLSLLIVWVFSGLFFISTVGNTQPLETASRAIDTTMQQQQTAWNNGDLEAFMAPYWQSDSLKFIGKNGVTYGWQATLERYRKSYPDRATMGILTFTIISHEKVGKKSVFTVGKWHLKREKGDAEGHFSLLWKKIKGKWVIVADHSS